MSACLHLDASSKIRETGGKTWLIGLFKFFTVVLVFLFSSQTSSASGRSDCPTVISVASNQSWSGIHSSTGTGISTERSSVFSWGYDVRSRREKKTDFALSDTASLAPSVTEGMFLCLLSLNLSSSICSLLAAK